MSSNAFYIPYLLKEVLLASGEGCNPATTQLYAKVLQKKVSSDMEILNKKLFE